MADDQDDPPKLEHGAPAWFHEYLGDLRQWLREHRPVAGLNCTLVDTPGGGKRIDVGVVPATILSPFPFQTSVFDGKYRVNLGTINNLVPSGLTTFRTYKPGDAAVLTVRTNGRQVVSASVGIDALPSPPECTIGAPPLLFKVPLALLQKSSVEQIVFNNLAALRSLCHQTERPYPITQPGMSPWINWWTWTVVPEFGPQSFPV